MMTVETKYPPFQQSQGAPASQNQGTGRLVLMAEPDPGFAKALRAFVEGNGFQVSIVATDDLLSQAKARQPYLILMDVDPEGNALKLCAELKSSPYTGSIPVALLSRALADEEAELQGFPEGGDDSCVHPASEELLRARIRSALRRYAPPNENLDANLQVEGLTMDVRSRKVYVNSVPVALTRKEF